MASFKNNSNGAKIIVVNSSGGQSNDSVPAYTVAFSDPSNTCTWDPTTGRLLPNGTNNTGVVTLTITNSLDGTQTVETINVVATSVDLEVVVSPL